MSWSRLTRSSYDDNSSDDCEFLESLSLLGFQEQTQKKSNVKQEFFYHILNWNPGWLQNEQYNKELPPMIDDVKLIRTLLKYSNASEYTSVMLPMLINEYWFVLKQDYEDLSSKKQRHKMELSKDDLISSESITVDSTRKIGCITITAKITKTVVKNRKFPHRGDLVELRSAALKNSSVFAYVKDVEERYQRSLGGINDHIKLKYKLITNISTKTIIPSAFTITRVSFSLGYINLLDALQKLPKFSLCKPILQPSVESYRMPPVDSHLAKNVNLSINGEKQTLNDVQSQIIRQVLNAIEDRNPRVSLIQGPPGTGKSKTIVNLTLSIFRLWTTKKILLAAPSNKAIDSLILKLLDVQENSEIPCNIVRVGDEEKMDDAVKHLSLTKQALARQELGRRRLFDIKKDILQQADIITSTLASCYTNFIMTQVFGINRSSAIEICIVDEAGQATELQTLVPLLLGVKKLILVGDQKQLPPVILSEKAKDNGYDTSLFARADKIFENEIPNPIVMLNTQYRMVNSISEWPNSYFYKGLLKNSATVNPLGICNYVLFNHNFPQDEDGHANPKEAELVVKLMKLLEKKLLLKESNGNNISMGIITPYHKQRLLILEKLQLPKKQDEKKILQQPKNKYRVVTLGDFLEKKVENALHSDNDDVTCATTSLQNDENIIEVNTVDSFQGSERDIIVISCVRSSGLGFTKDPNRLNVSLTRAKHTLIVFGNFKAYKGNEMWCGLISNAMSRNNFVDINDLDADSVFEKHVICKST